MGLEMILARSASDFTSWNWHLSSTRTVILPDWSAPYLRLLVVAFALLIDFISSPLLGVSWKETKQFIWLFTNCEVCLFLPVRRAEDK